MDGPPADAVTNRHTGHLLLPLWAHHSTMQHVNALVRPPVGQSCLMRGGVAVLEVTHSLQLWESPLGCLMWRYNRKPWVKWFWWSPQALISHTRAELFLSEHFSTSSLPAQRSFLLCAHTEPHGVCWEMRPQMLLRDFPDLYQEFCLCRCLCPDPVYTPTEFFSPTPLWNERCRLRRRHWISGEDSSTHHPLVGPWI